MDLKKRILNSNPEQPKNFDGNIQEAQDIYARGYKSWEEEKYNDALTDFTWLTINYPWERRFHIAVAGALQMNKEYSKALVSYGCAFILDELDPEPLYQIAVCLKKLEKKEDSIEALRMVIEISDKKEEHKKIKEKANFLLNSM